MALARFTKRPPALGSFNVGAKAYGHVPSVPRMRGGAGETPAIGGFFRAGPAIAISQINTMATYVPRGGGS